MKPYILQGISTLLVTATAWLSNPDQYTQPFLHAGLYPSGVNASIPGIGYLFTQPDNYLIAYGSARPAAVASRTNNATIAGDGNNQFSGTVMLTPPLYDVRFNLSNVSFSNAASEAGVRSGAKFLLNGVVEVILPDSEVSRLANERKTLEYRLVSIGRNQSHISQADDGSCNMVFNTTCRDALTTGVLYSATRNNTGATPDAFRELCGDFTINDYGFVVVEQAVSSASAAPIFTSQDISPRTLSLGNNGFFKSNWNNTATVQDDNDRVTLNNTSNEFNSYVRFIDSYNGTSSRASLSSLNFGNSTQQYYDALALFRALVVLERYIDPRDALNGTEYASVSCLRPSILTSRAMPLPDLYWQNDFNATTGNITDISMASGMTAGRGTRWGLIVSTVVAMAMAVL